MKARWLYFALFAAWSMPGRFLSIFLQNHHLDQTQIGILVATASLLSLFSAPAISNFADRTRKLEIVASISFALAMLFFFAQIPALPSVDIIPPHHRFLYLLICSVLSNMFMAAIDPLTSAITIAQLKKQYGHQGHARYGEERLWGAVSWAVCHMLLGFVLDLPNAGMWIIHAGLLLFGTTFTILLHFFAHNQTGTAAPLRDEIFQHEQTILNNHDDETTHSEIDTYQPPSTTSLSGLSVARLIIFSGGCAPQMFFNLIFWLGAGMSLVEKLLFLFFENELHATNLLCGLSVVVTVVFEIPIFAKAPALLNKLGAPALAVIGSLAFVVRGIGYANSPNGWVVLLFEPLHGVTYGAVQTAAVAYVADRTPPNAEATGQSLLSVVRGLGSTLGSVLGGYIMQRFGSKILYSGAAVVVFVAVVSFAAAEQLSVSGASRNHKYKILQPGGDEDGSENSAEVTAGMEEELT